MYLNQCIEFLDATFNENWLDKYLTIDEITGDVEINTFFDFERDIDKIIESYSDFFIQSIITGEYTDEIVFFEKLEEIKRYIQNATSINVSEYNEIVFEKLTFLNRVLNEFYNKYIGF